MIENAMGIEDRESRIEENHATPFAPRNLQRGFSLVSAIFLLVVIAALGTFAVTLSTTQHQSAAMDVMGSRAYQAARAGIEYVAHYVSQQSPGAEWATCNTGIPAVDVSASPNLAPFSPVTVNCRAASHVEGASPVWIYDVSAVANAGTLGGTDYVERVISVKMGK